MEREKNGENLEKKGENRLYPFSLQAEQGVNNQENNVKGRKAKKLTEKGEKHFYRFSLQAEQGVILSSASQILPNRR